jgi:hypothetical protein
MGLGFFPYKECNMKNWIVLILAVLFLLPMAQAANQAHRIGLGVNYWYALDDIEFDDIDETGFSYLVSYQFRPTLIGLQIDVEFLPDLFGEDAIAPAAYLVVGKAIYAAAGIGIVNQDGDFADEPFLALKAGLDLEVLPSIFLDISGSYRFSSKFDMGEALDEIDTDTVFLGAAVRMAF